MGLEVCCGREPPACASTVMVRGRLPTRSTGEAQLQGGRCHEEDCCSADDLVNEQEFIYPYYRLQEAGYEAVSLAAENRVHKGKNGVPFTPDAVIGNVKPGEFEGIIRAGRLRPGPSCAGRRQSSRSSRN